jgi:uncharacterized protein with von Willebrand factor type A (vWA) domain
VIRETAERGVTAETIVEFCRFARDQGLSVSVQETLGALEAVSVIGTANINDLRLALRSVLCSSKEDCDLFEQCFEAFWNAELIEPSSSDRPHPRDTRPPEISRRNTQGMMSTHSSGDDSSSEPFGAQAVTGASARERLAKADFSTLQQTDLAALEQIALRLFKQMARRLARRRRISTLRGQIDLRRTIRRNISRGGAPTNLRFRERRPRPHRLITLLDISGSMSPYSVFLMKFLFALQRHFRNVDTFLFSTSLFEITPLFRTRRLHDALHRLSQMPAGWAGGTSIGSSLREFNQLHRQKLRPGDTLFLILSDGLDTGDPSLLAAELSRIKRHVRRVIWLNPLLGMKDYQPLTGGMRAALKHIDVFVSAHSLESLLALERHLG